MSTTRAPDPRRYTLEVVAIRVLREPASAAYVGTILSGPEVVAELARDVLPDDDREHFGAFFLNTQNHVIRYHEISVGSVSASIVDPKVVFRAALLAGAVHVIVVHNHPSTDVTPSKEDIALTQQLVRGARLLNLTIYDHVIVEHGTCGWTSLASCGLISRT